MPELIDDQRLALEYLALGPFVPNAVVRWSAMTVLADKGLAVLAGGIYWITDAGRAALADAPEPGCGESPPA